MASRTDQAGQGEGFAEQASATAHEAASVAQEKASELRAQGSARVRDQFDRRSKQAGSQVRSLAEALRRSGRDLGSEGNTNGARLAEQAADRIDRAGSYLEQSGGDELMRDIETFARRRPWALAGLGVLAGAAGARFMKASSRRRYGQYRRTTGQQWPSRAGVGLGGSAYARGELEGGGAGPHADVADADAPSARDPYSGAR
jgi:hypothetical protein